MVPTPGSFWTRRCYVAALGAARSTRTLGVMNVHANLVALCAVLAFASGCAKSQTDAYQGFLVIAPEVEIFTLCGTDSPLWLDYSPALRDILFERYEQLRLTPYDQTYAELRGVPGPKLACGFCEDYSGSFRVDAVVVQRAKNPSDCHDT